MTLYLAIISWVQQQKHRQQKKKQINWTSSNLKAFVHQRTLSTEWKGNPQNGRKYLHSIYLVKNDIQNIYRTPTTQQQKTNNPIHKWAKDLNRHSPKEIHKWPKSTRRCSTSPVKSKPQWETTSHPLGWLLSKQKITSVGEDIEKLEPLCIVNVKWCSCYGKQYGGSSKN